MILGKYSIDVKKLDDQVLRALIRLRLKNLGSQKIIGMQLEKRTHSDAYSAMLKFKEKEIMDWNYIKNYECIYEISRNGEVRSVDRTIINAGFERNIKGVKLKWNITPRGYATVCLAKHGINKRFLVHRLLGEAYLPNPKGLKQINHKDGNKLNNNLRNLEWVTCSDNHRHAYRLGLKKKRFGMQHHNCKLSDIDIRNIRKSRANKENTNIELAKIYNVSSQYISDIIRNLERKGA